MESFEEMGLSPELVAALASEGAEEPTPFQVAAIPVLRRGNNLLGNAGPGAGTLIAYGAALLDRLEPGAGTPRALVLTSTAESAQELAEVLARVGLATGHQVSAAGTPWVLPERADVLFGTPGELLAWTRAGRLDLKGVDALVIEQAGAHQRAGGLAEIETLLEFLPKDGQRIVLALPATPEVESFVERHARRAVQIPAEAADVAGTGGPKRGEVQYRIVEEPRESGALHLISELLEDARHCCLFFGSEDRAADVGDYLTLHGYAAGAPGDDSVPVWLAVQELDAREALAAEGVVAVSYDAPAGPDSLDRRHGSGRGGTIVVLPREMPHLRDVARRTGYRVVPFPPPLRSAGRSELDALLGRLETAAGQIDLAPYLVALEPLLNRHGAAEIAAAAVAMLRERTPTDSGTAPTGAPEAKTKKVEKPAASAPRKSEDKEQRPGTMARLYISLGERDSADTRQIMGAVTGESGIPGSKVGKIEVRDTFSIVEVEESVAELVIRSLNGITVRGRSVRADFDRGRTRERDFKSDGGERAPRSDAPRRGPREEGARRGPREEGARRGPREEGARRGPREEGARRAPRGEGSSRGARGDDSPRRGGPRDQDARRPTGGGSGAPPRGGSGGPKRPRDDDRPPSRGPGRPAGGGKPSRGGPGGAGGKPPRSGPGGKPPRGPGGKPPRRGPPRDRA